MSRRDIIKYDGVDYKEYKKAVAKAAELITKTFGKNDLDLKEITLACIVMDYHTRLDKINNISIYDDGIVVDYVYEGR